jgi:hypothetical protein
VWVTGTYEDGFGPDGALRVTHRRTIRFLDGARWVIEDELLPQEGDTTQHRYDALFHFGPEDVSLSDDGVTVVARMPDGAGIRLAPRSSGDGGLAPQVRLVHGQEEPYVLGWRRARGAWAGGAGGREPVWVALFTYTAAGPARWSVRLDPFGL